MTEPQLPPPPTAPPPRVQWLRTIAVICVGLCFVLATFISPPNGYFLAALLAMILSPVLLIAWLWKGFRRPTTSNRSPEFRQHCAWVWLGLVVLLTAPFFVWPRWHLDPESAGLMGMVFLLWTTPLGIVALGAPRLPGSKAFWKRTVFAVACFATLIALAYGWENWTGKRAWDEARREYEAQGISFDFKKFHPARVRDAENVGSHPLFAFPFTDAGRGRKPRDQFTQEENRLQDHFTLLTIPANKNLDRFDKAKASAYLPIYTNGLRFHDLEMWRQFFHNSTNDVQQPEPKDVWKQALWRLTRYPVVPGSTDPAVDVKLALTKLDASFALVEEALRRPECRMAVPWEQEDAAGIILPHLAFVRNITQAYSLRASAHLTLGETEAAFRDLQTGLRVANLISNETFLVCMTAKRSATANALGCAVEGLARHQWAEPQLLWFSDFARSCDYLADYSVGLRTDVAMWAQYWNWARQNRQQADWILGQECAHAVWFPWLPSGWYYRHQLAEIRLVLDRRLHEVDLEHRRYVHQPVQEVDRTKRTRENLIHALFTPKETYHEPRGWQLGWVRGQVAVDQLVISCALERHWLRHRAYPEKLDALVPEFLDRIPHDIFDGQPMRYRREGEQGFVLWSVGFDGKDDNAAPLSFSQGGGVVGEEVGDLVWRYPQTK